MTTPSPGARKIAERYVKCPDYCMMFFWPDGSIRVKCTCGEQARVTALAQAIEEYGKRAVSDFAALHKIENQITADLIRYAYKMPLHQEDANEVP